MWGFGFWGLGFRVWGLGGFGGFSFEALGFGTQSLALWSLVSYPNPREDPKSRSLNEVSYKVPLVV